MAWFDSPYTPPAGYRTRTYYGDYDPPTTLPGYQPIAGASPPRPRPTTPPGGFTFGRLTTPQSIFYNDPANRGVAWQMLKDYLNASGNTRYDSFLDQQMANQYNRFLSANAKANNALKWTDWITQNQNMPAEAFQNLPTAQRGGSPGLYGANQRFVG